MRTGRVQVTTAMREFARVYSQVGRGKFCTCVQRLGYTPFRMVKHPGRCQQCKKEVA